MKLIDHNGPGLYYALFYRKAQNPAPMTRVEVRQKPVKNRHSYTITETNFFEQFEFQVQAINAFGPGPKSAIVYGYSGEKCKWNTIISVQKYEAYYQTKNGDFETIH